MDLMGLCSKCGKAGAMHTCSMCGSLVCSDCYDSLHGVCCSCKVGKK